MSENDDLITLHNVLAENVTLKVKYKACELDCSRAHAEVERLNKAVDILGKYPGGWDEVFLKSYETAQKLRAENERMKKEIEHWNVLEAERAEWLRKTIGSAGLEHFVREWMDLKDECDRYKAALEKIADYPPGHWRFDCKDFADCIDISRKALAGEK